MLENRWSDLKIKNGIKRLISSYRSVISTNNEYVKDLKRENQNIREKLNDLEKNREDIAFYIGEDTDYYSFLQGFDYAIESLRNALK